MQITHSDAGRPDCWLESFWAAVLVVALVSKRISVVLATKSVDDGPDVFDELLVDNAEEVVGNSKRVKFEGEQERRLSSILKIVD